MDLAQSRLLLYIETYMKKLIYTTVAVAILLLAGLLVPLGSFTTNDACQPSTAPTTTRLHVIKGDSLNEVKNRKDVQGAGCAISNTKYVLYFL
jgi:hypothetical protein